MGMENFVGRIWCNYDFRYDWHHRYRRYDNQHYRNDHRYLSLFKLTIHKHQKATAMTCRSRLLLM